jgi:lysophospholipase L1-like esterase
MKLRSLVLAIFITLSLSAVGQSVKKILFVGNSLTYTNDLPDLVTKSAKTKGQTIQATMLAHPNYALEDHWNDGQLQKLIEKEKYDFVIVQQGPSSQAEGRAMLLNDGKRIKSICDQNNSKLVFFIVWPAKPNLHMMDGVIKNYTDAAAETQSILCPVGEVWKERFEAGDYSYYGPDEFHPSFAGSESAAKIIVEALFP